MRRAPFFKSSPPNWCPSLEKLRWGCLLPYRSASAPFFKPSLCLALPLVDFGRATPLPEISQLTGGKQSPTELVQATGDLPAGCCPLRSLAQNSACGYRLKASFSLIRYAGQQLRRIGADYSLPLYLRHYCLRPCGAGCCPLRFASQGSNSAPTEKRNRKVN